MPVINRNTTIAELLKQHPDALEVIISIAPKFSKLRNPILRKLMAPRTTIAMASKVGGVKVQDFFGKLQPLGFEAEGNAFADDDAAPYHRPDFMNHLSPDMIHELDVRPEIARGSDPLSLIMQHIKIMPEGKVLRLINSFEPAPLVALLGKQGFQSFVETVDDNTVITWFYHPGKATLPDLKPGNGTEGYEEMLKAFEGRVTSLDVRAMEMPMPMMTILEALNGLPHDYALFVHHKRVPVFLIPELSDRGFDYRIREISDTEVHMIIFRKQ